MARIVRCTAATLHGGQSKMRQFTEAAAVVAECAADTDDLSDAYVTLLVHAGIAAADVLCCARLGEHATGESHNDAVSLLAKVDRRLSLDLRKLLGMKTKAGYSHQPAAMAERARAQRACSRLV